MAYSPTKLGKVSVLTQSAWGTHKSAGDFTSAGATSILECEIVIPSATQQMLIADVMSGEYAANPRQAGSKASTFSITFPLHGWTSSAVDGNVTTTSPEMLLFENAMGGLRSHGWESAAVNSGTGDGSNVILATSSTGDAGTVGQCVRVPLLAGGAGLGWVKNMDDGAGGGVDDLDFVYALPGQASTSGNLEGSAVTYITTAQALPLSIQVLGYDAGNAFRFADCCVTSATITCTPGQVPMATVEVMSATWYKDTAGGAMAAYTTSYPQLASMTATNGSRLISTTGAMPVNSFEFNVAVSHSTAASHASPSGIAQYIVTGRTATVTLTMPATTAALSGMGATTTARGAYQLDMSTASGASMSLLLADTFQVEAQSLEDSDGIVAINASYEAKAYTGDTTDSGVLGAAANTNCRLAWL